jgi:hypothetical protein
MTSFDRRLKKTLLASAAAGAISVACVGSVYAQVAIDPLAGGDGALAAAGMFSTTLAGDVGGGSRVIDFFESEAVNTLAADNTSQDWGFNITNTVDQELNNGDTFTEFFGFNIQIARPPATGFPRDYAEQNVGLGLEERFHSVLWFDVVASGFIGGLPATGTTDVNFDWNFTYTAVTFELFLDEDGGVGGHDRDVHLATFTGDGFADAFINDITDIFWTTTLDCVHDATWLIGGVNPASAAAGGCVEVEDGGGDGDFFAVDPNLAPVTFKVSRQQVLRSSPLIGTAYTDAGGTNTYTFDAEQAGQGNHEFIVPEPTSAAILGSGLIALGALRRRRQNKKA